MKSFKIENVIDQSRIITHLFIILFSLIVVAVSAYLDTQPGEWSLYFNIFLITFIQIEVFLFFARLIFRNLNPGTTPAEITRRLLSRFAFFIFVCLVAAFIIFLSFRSVRELINGGNIILSIGDFFRFSFFSWFKSTIAGLTVGAIIFIVVLWQDALQSEQKLKEENLIFQNETLRNQVNPHFLFNCLNTLSALVETQPETSQLFISRLSAIYRYILENGGKDKVSLESELEFIRKYFDLHKIRDEEKIDLAINIPDAGSYNVLPVSLQILMENAIKHNIATRESPLQISIYVENEFIVVRNNLQKMAIQPASTKIGLKNLGERIRLVTGKSMVIQEERDFFTVKVPLIK